MASPPCSPAQGRVCQDWYGISRVRDWMIASGASLVVWKLSLHPSLRPVFEQSGTAANRTHVIRKNKKANQQIQYSTFPGECC
jgi:hypothetical protein